MFDRFGRSRSSAKVVEVLSVGGKGLFAAYAKVLSACGIRYSVIADRDYIEQIGSQDIRNLFRVDSREIKNDVIENPKSLDGEALVTAIDVAMKQGDWNHASEVWEYIKSRRREVRTDLSDREKSQFLDFLESKRKERVYVLSRGALEAYLPVGFASKDLERLIRFLTDDQFWGQLRQEGLEEIEGISRAILPT